MGSNSSSSELCQRHFSVGSNSTSGEEIISSLYTDLDTIKKELLPGNFQIHKVSPHLRMQKGHHNDEPSVYDPISVSLGPYHHGKEEFRRAEKFKYLCLDWCTQGDEEKKTRLFNMILRVINRVRDCYADVSILSKYDDNSLARMMLLDACFIINFMRIRASDIIAKDSYNCLGVAAALPFAARDILVLENQIPFFVLELILSLPSRKRLLEGFMIEILSVDPQRARIPREDGACPLHLLEACRRVLVQNPIFGDYDDAVERLSLISQRPDSGIRTPNAILDHYRINRKDDAKGSTGNASREPLSYYITCSSVTYLKTKGIHCHPSLSIFLKDINFTPHACSGVLQLPVCYASNLTLVFLSNMIAYEIAPGNVAHSPDLTVLSYVSLMKSLIQTPADVIELQKKGILRLNRFANHELVVQIFKSIETFNLRDVNIYQDVMCKVGEHCSSNSKTWMADLIYCKFKNPWTTRDCLDLRHYSSHPDFSTDCFHHSSSVIIYQTLP